MTTVYPDWDWGFDELLPESLSTDSMAHWPLTLASPPSSKDATWEQSVHPDASTALPPCYVFSGHPDAAVSDAASDAAPSPFLALNTTADSPPHQMPDHEIDLFHDDTASVGTAEPRIKLEHSPSLKRRPGPKTTPRRRRSSAKAGSAHPQTPWKALSPSPSSPRLGTPTTDAADATRAKHKHNHVEQRYRARLSRQFAQLLAVLPKDAGEECAGTPAKGEILDMARRRICALVKEGQALRSALDALGREHAATRTSLWEQRLRCWP